MPLFLCYVDYRSSFMLVFNQCITLEQMSILIVFKLCIILQLEILPDYWSDDYFRVESVVSENSYRI